MICILVVLVFFFLFLAALISIQLMRTADVDPNERIAASRMCYYLLMAALIYVSTSAISQYPHADMSRLSYFPSKFKPIDVLS